MDFQREHIGLLKKRVEEEPRQFIQVLYGPRQVGKTTLVHQFLTQTDISYHFTSADAIPAANVTWIAQQWETARIKLSQLEEDKLILVIDEIQKIDNWSEQIKKEWDKDSNTGIELYVIILGSSRLMLKRGLTESLAGRYESIYMGHWSYPEMKNAFGYLPEEYVWFGGYPGAAFLKEEEIRWKKYVKDALIEPTVSNDILMMTRIDKPALMKQLFELGCSYSGQILSYNKILGQLHDAGNTTTLSHYLDLLDSAGLLGGISKFTPNKIRKRASSPKFQVYNTSLLSVQQSESFEAIRAKPAEWGRWVESAVGAHLLNYSLKEDFELSYWRHRNDEVDFVIKQRDKIIGIEVKSTAAGPTTGMKAFQNNFEPYKMLLISESGLPWQEFLCINPATLFN
ncbi:ATP-binding protein [Gracilimonas sp.]|uniref:ATP-binding protein n=1 Tax=Gracilimonas sp. TaxID=1974203 RepID=UPI002871F64B|nr:ATP-binding protein [Gracilimonas sp.]